LTITHKVILTLLAIIFTIGLTTASIELPLLVDEFLYKTINTPDVATGLNKLSEYKTDLYLQYYNLRLIGYVCLGLVVFLIVIGFVTGRTGWTTTGALFLFLPVFGHFAATMFFLGGLGFLRLIWLPFLDASFNLFRLGDIINLPYNILGYIYSFTRLNRSINLAYIIIGTGLLIFFLGTLTWFYARIQKKNIADFGIYRCCRHPQYLGWIIWSYGMLFLPGSNIRLCYELSNSLPWLISTMIIIGVAMIEELKMRKVHGVVYGSYCRRAPFLVPVPRFISKLINLPLRFMFKKEYPERKREIVAVLVFYTLICLGVSVFYSGVVSLPERKIETSTAALEKLVQVLRNSTNFGLKRQAAAQLEKIGEPAMEPLIQLLSDDQSQVRAYSAAALGGIKSELVVAPLIALLHDQDAYVRRTAAESLGRTGSSQTFQPLVEALYDRTRGIASAAVGALSKIKHEQVIPTLIKVLPDSTLKVTAAAARALGDLGAKEAIESLLLCYEQQSNCPYDVVGTALWKLNSDRAADVWISGIKKGSWWYPRVCCITELGKNKLEQGLTVLQEALQDSSVEVRRAAVLALMEFRSEKTVESLRAALLDKDFEVRMYAQEALKKIKSTY
jgi:HEAT repeat protein/protein-S-isoprenylcysteine O-methyltransferase Ste14